MCACGFVSHFVLFKYVFLWGLRSDRLDSSCFSKHYRLKLFHKGKGKVFLSVFFILAFVASNWIKEKRNGCRCRLSALLLLLGNFIIVLSESFTFH